jgi:hypothetical protein
MTQEVNIRAIKVFRKFRKENRVCLFLVALVNFWKGMHGYNVRVNNKILKTEPIPQYFD